jgi:hypothetical protein
MLNAFTSIIFNFTVDEQNTTSLKKISGYIFIDNKQTFITDYSNTSAGRFEKNNEYFVFIFISIGLHKFSTGAESLFESGRGNSYRCNTETQIKDIQTNGTLNITSINIENLQVQPFVDDSKEFNTYNTGKFLIKKTKYVSYLNLYFRSRL